MNTPKIRKLEVFTEENERYPLLVGAGVRSSFAAEFPLVGYSKVFVLSEEAIAEKWRADLPKTLSDAEWICIPAGEESKTIENVEFVWKELLARRADRRSLLMNIGGGMVTDLGGFAASTFMRGISFLNFPTTLLSQVDASIGGKNGVNFESVKNLIGTFTQPKAVFIDTDFLRTLPTRELNSGVAEVLKHGLIADRTYFENIVARLRETPFHEFEPQELSEIIFRSCEIKSEVVAADELESGRRKTLNLGHTFGHAVESLSHRFHNPLLHGEAISIGMAFEARLSEALHLLEGRDVETIIAGLSTARLPVHLPKYVKFPDLYSLMLRDKKNVNGEISWTLLESIGHAVYDRKVSMKVVEQVFQDFL